MSKLVNNVNKHLIHLWLTPLMNLQNSAWLCHNNQLLVFFLPKLHFKSWFYFLQVYGDYYVVAHIIHEIKRSSDEANMSFKSTVIELEL